MILKRQWSNGVILLKGELLCNLDDININNDFLTGQ